MQFLKPKIKIQNNIIKLKFQSEIFHLMNFEHFENLEKMNSKFKNYFY